MTTVALLIAAWLVTSLVLATALGAAIRLRDRACPRRRPPGDVVPVAARRGSRQARPSGHLAPLERISS